jgi:hypothetical protein
LSHSGQLPHDFLNESLTKVSAYLYTIRLLKQQIAATSVT